MFANISSSLINFRISIDRLTSFSNELHLLTTLSQLTIYGITFPMLDSTVFHSFENSLTSLEMSHANFERIPAAVCRLKYLKSFRSDSSPNLGRYNGSIFDACNHTMTTVTSLTLRFDQLTTIPKLVHIFPSLQSLGLYGNNLHFVESSSLAGLNSLTELNLGANHLTRIPFAVSMTHSLHYLFVQINQIDTVEESDLSRLQNLTYLYLSNNPLVYVAPFAFTHNPLLNNIYMQSTNIGYVPGALLGLDNLRYVQLSGKPIVCSCHDMVYLKSWNVTSINIDATCSSGKAVKTYLASDLPKCP